MRYYSFLTLLAALSFSSVGHSQLHLIRFGSADSMHSYFSYSSHDAPIISGHRGSYITGYPENAIETFAYVLKHTPAFFEVDPRLTKDSMIVLLHDSTLDRTTTGKGGLADYTWNQVQQFRLKDRDGKITPYHIPTLESALAWARGKTILNLDKKDVPPAMIIRLLRRMNAETFVMITVHDAAQAKFYYDDNHNRMMSAFVKTAEALTAYENAGVPWKNTIAYIGSVDTSANKKMYELLHARGVKCMISAAPVYDKLNSANDRADAYRNIFVHGADILESDYPVEVATAIKVQASLRTPGTRK